MSSEIAIKVQNISKCYQIYEKPHDRLKQFLYTRLQHLIGRQPKRYYREFWALKDVSFEVKRGETIGIVGCNGSGKSTLLQVICGILNPTGGVVETHGRLAALLELGSGFNPEFSGRENVFLNASILGLSKKEIEDKFDDIAAFADIGEFIDQPVKTYSSGMFVRLAFAIQANVDPDIFIVDEALAVGDTYFVHRCMHRFHEMQRKGKTIILVTHDATAVRQLCDRAIWVDGGIVVAMGDKSEIIDSYLSHLFLKGQDSHDVSPVFLKDVSKVKENIAVLKSKPTCPHETEIPNVDKRLGNRLCEIVGIGVYDMLGTPLKSTRNDTDIVLRASIKNNHSDKRLKMGVGYTFRNARGVDISSSDTVVTNTDIGYCVPGEIMTVSMVIGIPCLHPGSYTIIPSTGYIDKYGISVETDKIVNAVVLEVTSDIKVDVGMRFKTKFKVDS